MKQLAKRHKSSHSPCEPMGVSLARAPLDGVANKARVDEGVDEPHVVLCKDALYAARKRLHHLVIDCTHQTEVEEDQPPVVSEHDIALVRVSMHEAGEHEPSGHRLAAHVRHTHRFLAV